MPSKRVFIKRRENYTALPTDLYNEGKRILASVWDRGTRDILRADLSKEEEEKILAPVLGRSRDDLQFQEVARRFWADIRINIESGEGTMLEIGLNDDGVPINRKDYLIYKYCLRHPFVAKSKEELQPDNIFYIDNKEESIKKQYNLTQERKKAQKAYLQITKEEAMDNVIRLMGTFTKDYYNPDKMSSEEKEILLEKLSVEHPSKFYEVAQDKNLEIKSFIEKCVTDGHLSKDRNSYFFGDEMIGESIDQAIGYLTNENNTKTYNALRARLKK